MLTNKELNIYNSIAVVATIIYLTVFAYFIFIIMNSSGQDAMAHSLSSVFIILLGLPVSSLVFSVLISFIPVEPKLQKQLSYGVFAVFLLAYFYIRIISPYINDSIYQSSGLGILDILVLICGAALLIPSIIGNRRIKNINERI